MELPPTLPPPPHRGLKIYVASSWRNPRQSEVVAALRAAGHQVYDFKNPLPGKTGFSWRKIVPEPPPWSAEKTREVLRHPVSEEGFGLDFNAMQWADAIVMVQPCGRSAALELGWGCGAGKLTVALLEDGQEPELMLKCADHLATSLDEVLSILRRSEGRAARRPLSSALPLAEGAEEIVPLDAPAWLDAPDGDGLWWVVRPDYPVTLVRVYGGWRSVILGVPMDDEPPVVRRWLRVSVPVSPAGGAA